LTNWEHSGWQISPGEYEKILGLLQKMFCFVAAVAHCLKDNAYWSLNKMLLEAVDKIYSSDRDCQGMTVVSTLKDGLTNC
jgi:hypothetical protein